MTFAVSTLVLILIAYGLKHRKNAKIHVPVMLAAFGIDILLVLWIELNRQAIEHVVENAESETPDGLLMFHVAVSLLSIIFYVILTVLGFKIMKGERTLLKLHRNLGGLFLIFRLSNYVTSFYVNLP